MPPCGTPEMTHRVLNNYKLLRYTVKCIIYGIFSTIFPLPFVFVIPNSGEAARYEMAFPDTHAWALITIEKR